MKNIKVFKTNTAVFLFITLNIIYGFAAINLKAPSILGEIAANITIVTTYPYKTLLTHTYIKPSGWLIELNFVLISSLLTYLIFKLKAFFLNSKL